MKQLIISALVAAVAAGAAWSDAAVKGLVKFEGQKPERQVLDTGADAYCKRMHATDPLLSDAAVIADDGGFQHIFVFIANPPEKEYPAPAEPVVLDQKGCRYEPHVFGILVGQQLAVRNGDETTHNVRGFATKNRAFNFGQPAGSEPRTREFTIVEEALKIKCDIHPWMQSYAFVLPHPFFAVTDSAGNYEIKNVPAGTYTLKAWHERLGYMEQQITVADAEARADFTFKRE